MWRIFKLDQDEDGAGNGGGGASQTGGAGAGVAEGAGAPNAQAGAGSSAANQDAGKGGSGQSSATEQFELEFDGQKGKYTRQQLIDAIRKDKDYTVKTQEVAKTRREQLARMARLDQMETEYQERLKKGGKAEDGEGREGDEQPDPVKALTDRQAALESKALVREWLDVYNPIAAKYPSMDEDRLRTTFLERVKLGEVEDSAAGVMKTAESVAKEIDSEGTANEDKLIDKILANPKHPKLEAFVQKKLAEFVAGKVKLAAAGGDSEKGHTADAQPGKKRDISEIAAEIRSKIA